MDRRFSSQGRRSLGAARASADGPYQGALRGHWYQCSPRERGWTARAGGPHRGHAVQPARARMDRRRRSRASGARPCSPRERGWTTGHGPRHDIAGGCSPRASADGQSTREHTTSLSPCSQRVRGWSEVALLIAPALPQSEHEASASADGPDMWVHVRTIRRCSPRERGWSRGEPPHPARRDRVRVCADAIRLSPTSLRQRRRARACADGPESMKSRSSPL
jgi:hypothetical protein